MILIYVAFFFQEQNKHVSHIMLYNNKQLTDLFPNQLTIRFHYWETTDMPVVLNS